MFLVRVFWPPYSRFYPTGTVGHVQIYRSDVTGLLHGGGAYVAGPVDRHLGAADTFYVQLGYTGFYPDIVI